MPVVARDRAVGAELDAPIGRQRPPARPFFVLLDAGLAAGAYGTAYWLRFPSDSWEMMFAAIFPTATTLVAAQLAALLMAQAYAPRPSLMLRVVAGIVAGTTVSAAVLERIVGIDAAFRGVFLADALLLSIVAVGWRCVWALRARSRVVAVALAQRGHLVDRSAEMLTLGGVVTSVWRYRELLKNLVLKDLKLKYRGSVFGFLWSLINPLLMIVVYTIAFTYILNIRSEGFVFYLMLGLLAWTFFNTSAAMSTGAVVDNSGLLKSVLFPRSILPVGTVLFNLAQYLLTVSVFLPTMMLWYQVPLSQQMLLFPVFLGLQVIFTIGLALLLATWTAFFRDVRHLLDVALSMMFWTTPIVYELRQVPEPFRLAILMSPMSPFVDAYQSIFFYREWPEPMVWVLSITYACTTFVAGAWLFLAFDDRLTEQL